MTPLIRMRMGKVTEQLRRGLNVIGENSQLNYTLFVMLVVVVVFTHLATQFVGVAREAQERLMRVRAAAIHDSVSLFADPAELVSREASRDTLAELANRVQTLRELVVVSFEPEGPLIVNALDPRQIGDIDANYLDLYQRAASDPRRSYGREVVVGEERAYQVVRIITDEEGTQVGALRTGMTLSEADRLINENIQRSLIGFAILLVLLLVLFLRHARIVDYASLYRRLQEVDALKDDFIAMATHELRTPLTVIAGYIDLLGESDLPESGRAKVEKIRLSAAQLQELIEDMLDVSRLEQGRMTFELETLSAAEELAQFMGELKPEAAKKGLTLNLETVAHPLIEVDRRRFRQIVINLIGNAIKYTKEGGVTMTLTYEDGSAIIRVRDTGIGMTAEEREHIFDKFSRVQNADTRGIRGTGLGLWLTKQMVEEMGGTIAVESIRNVGTHVILHFPSEPPQQ
ncbi:hypothetical protein GVX82_01705 [Patescibacteria group bacterium]|nr:hypothetical protein [Patescibacteria group bacterium]